VRIDFSEIITVSALFEKSKTIALLAMQIPKGV